jgi:hypothetical protein
VYEVFWGTGLWLKNDICGNKPLRLSFSTVQRLHQGIDQQIPNPPDSVDLPKHEQREVIGLPVLGGLHYDYRWVA